MLPPIREGSVHRERLQRTLQSATADVVVLTAPPGYGKTTALAAWTRGDRRPVAWLSLDRTHQDPTVLLSDVAHAVDDVIKLDPALLRRIDRAGESASLGGIRRLTRAVEDALAASGEQIVLVLDDVHVVTDQRGNDLIASLIERLPEGSSIAVSTREAPTLPLGRIRSHGRLLELGSDELAMDDDEAAALFRGAGVELSPDGVAMVNARAEGWPAGLYLAALSLRSGGDPRRSVATLTGDDRLIASYVREELLDPLPAEHVTFLTRISVLDRFCADLCDAVAGTATAREILAEQVRSNQFLVPIDARRGWFRFHQLFREVLRAELERREPGVVLGLHARAAVWLEAAGSIEEAIEHAHASGDEPEAARLVSSVGRAYGASGRLPVVRRWIAAFDEADVVAYPPLAVLHAWALAFEGKAAASRWVQIAERGTFRGPMPDGSASLSASIALLRALIGGDGPERMLIDARTAVAAEPPESPWRAAALLLLGVALVLNGRVDEASRRFDESAAAAGPGQMAALVAATTWQAIVAADGGNWDSARSQIERARSLVDNAGLGDDAPHILTFAISALVDLRWGDTAHATEELARAHRLRPESSTAISWIGVEARLIMARAHISSDDIAGARAVLREAREIATRGPAIGTLNVALDELEEHVRELRHSGVAGSTALTVAELRVLGLLPTHLSFREIAERLFVSRNTVKTQAISVYRKLGVTSRSEAVIRGRELGLIDA
jgi:LuxR family maltose regulon positive regulatory protein